jgi:hypothetical protein
MTVAGQNVAAEISRLRQELGCGISTVKPNPTPTLILPSPARSKPTTERD